MQPGVTFIRDIPIPGFKIHNRTGQRNEASWSNVFNKFPFLNEKTFRILWKSWCTTEYSTINRNLKHRVSETRKSNRSFLKTQIKHNKIGTLFAKYNGTRNKQKKAFVEDYFMWPQINEMKYFLSANFEVHLVKLCYAKMGQTNFFIVKKYYTFKLKTLTHTQAD